MLITNEMPAVSWTVSDTIGNPTWEAAAPLSRLTTGRPRIGVRLFRTSGSLGFYLDATWATGSKPRVIALLGLGEEWEGQSVTLLGKSVVTGNYDASIDTVQAQRLPDGSLAIIYVLATDTLSQNINGLRIVGLGTGAAYLIGEVVIATAQEWSIRRDWVEAVAILTKQNVTVTGQPFNVVRNQARKATVTICPQQWSKTVSIASIETLQKLQAGLSSQRPVLVIPALRAPGLGAGAAVDTDTVYASALFGWCSDVGQIELINGSNLAQLRLQFTEAPAGRVN